METRLAEFRAIMGSWKAKLAVYVPGAAAAYQFGCDQFGFPTLPEAWSVTGAAIPWWGWLLIAQAGFVFALFEYIRRNIPVTSDRASDSLYEGDSHRIISTPLNTENYTEVLARLAELDRSQNTHEKAIEDAKKDMLALEERLEKLFEAYSTINQRFSAQALVSKLHEMESEMSQLAAELMESATNEEPLDTEAWDDWLESMERWLDLLQSWYGEAEWYVFNPRDRIWEIYESGYDALTVKDSKFPFDVDAARKVKRFMILHRRWGDLKDDVHIGLGSLIYSGHPLSTIVAASRERYAKRIQFQ